MTCTWLIGLELEDWCDWVCYCQITGLHQSDGRIRRHQIWNPLWQTLQVNFGEEKRDKHQVHICWFEPRLNLLKPHSLFSHIWLLTRFLLLQKWRVRQRKKSTCIKNNSRGMKKCRIELGSSVCPLEVLLFFPPRKFCCKSLSTFFSPSKKQKMWAVFDFSLMLWHVASGQFETITVSSNAGVFFICMETKARFSVKPQQSQGFLTKPHFAEIFRSLKA